ncbi:hypothetical protein [Glycomyces buryatensis]|uniref:Uncharacterized protein n=1 Tax=Glycomyces buryatensis TaxID=2570927 RepID=A0A4V4HSK2_9ACTN|nr:hypothetical protein [Glycomyces buryatensis]THV41896.1 hypothetical protein FAB82_09260 [Glycomyces buryatensis]
MNDDSLQSGIPLPATRTPISRVVREVIEEVAPDETPIVDRMEGSSNSRAVRRLERSAKRSEPLAFGVEDLIPLVAPVVWIVLTKFLETIGENTAQSLWDRLLRWLRLRRLETVPPLTAEEIESACGAVREALLGKGFEADNADRITGALKESLRRHSGPDELGSGPNPD